MKIEIWAEGANCNEGIYKSFLIGTYQASCFDEAVKMLVNENESVGYFKDGSAHYWGCELFDNEHDARVLFG